MDLFIPADWFVNPQVLLACLSSKSYLTSMTD